MVRFYRRRSTRRGYQPYRPFNRRPNFWRAPPRLYRNRSHKSNSYRRFQLRSFRKMAGTRSISFYDNLAYAINEPALGIVAMQRHIDSLFGPAYYANAQGKVLDQDGNPTTIGDGILAEINKRNPQMTFTRPLISALDINMDYLADGFYRLNPDLHFSQFYVKGFKVTMRPLATSENKELYAAWTMDADTHPLKYKQTLNTFKQYFTTKKSNAGYQYNGQNRQDWLMWTIPIIKVAGPVGTKIKIKLYCKPRASFVNR